MAQQQPLSVKEVEELQRAHARLTEGYIALHAENEELKARVAVLQREHLRDLIRFRNAVILEAVQRSRRDVVDVEEAARGRRIVEMMVEDPAERAAFLAPNSFRTMMDHGTEPDPDATNGPVVDGVELDAFDPNDEFDSDEYDSDDDNAAFSAYQLLAGGPASAEN